MSPENESKLYLHFPRLFAQMELPISESPMGSGIACGDGWFPIIWDLSVVLSSMASAHKSELQFTQMKEKFGVLRIYGKNFVEAAWGAVLYAEHLSSKTCEVCGGPSRVNCHNYWLTTRCRTCLSIS